MVAACFISAKMGLISWDQEQRCVDGIARVGLPTRLSFNIAPSELMEAMTLDKKSVSGVSRWTLLKDIGAVAIDREVPTAIVLEAISRIETR
jgi:3-dehydroquinate synthetase